MGQVLRSVGGLHAIAMIAGEGEITAILALQKGCKEDPSLLLEADTYASILSLFSSEKDHLDWRQDESSCSKVETAAFELLAHLCLDSAKGRAAVEGAHDYKSSLSRALEVISNIIPDDSIGIAEAGNEEQDEDDVEDDVDVDVDDGGESTEQEKGKNRKEEQKALSTEPILTKIEDPKLLVASYSFLSAMTPVHSARVALLENGKFIQASSALIVDSSDSNLQFAALRTIAKLAPYSSGDGQLSAESVGELLQSALAAEPKISANENFEWNPNLFHAQAAEAVLAVFDSLPESKQKSIFNNVITRYGKLLKSQSIARATKSSRANGGELAYNLTTLMMAARGKDCVDKCFDSNLVSSLVNTVQWRYDPKTVVEEDAAIYWDATTTQCLQILAQILYREETALAKAGIKVVNLKNSAFMVARPGKAPRKAIDFPSALKLISQNGEAAAKIASQRILSYLNNN